MSRIYLDHAATTPLDPAAARAMEPWLRGEFGNPSSLHQEGRKAKEALDAAREEVSDALGCLFAEVIFTGSGTEAANLAIVGVARASLGGGRRRILLGASEHHCVLHAEGWLRALGYEVELLPVDREGRVQPETLEAALGPDVLLVSVMHANNEFGSINLVSHLAEMAHRAGALFHTDAVQTFLSLPWKVADLGADLVSVSAHKVYGPKGVGALYLGAGTDVAPMIVGGGQERERRSGTENVAGIVGFGAAVASYGSPTAAVRAARDAFVQRLSDVSHPVWTLRESTPALPGHAHLRFPGVDAETMLIVLDRLGVSASSGAACSSGSLEPSHVLLAAGYSLAEAKEGLRFSFGRANTVEEAAEAADRVAAAVAQIRGAR